MALDTSIARAVIAVVVFGIFPVMAQAQFGVPDLSLNVAARQNEDEVLSQSIHEFRLDCFKSQCELTAITLNQCSDNGLTGKKDAPVLVQRYSTENASLKVSATSANAVVAEFRSSGLGGDAAVILLFSFESAAAGSLMSRRVASFSGGFTKHSVILNRMITVQYVPLRGTWNSVSLSCAVLLPGIGK